MSRVIVGLSGGVDSSVAAYLLKEKGYDVHGLFMKNWEDQEGVLTSSCTWEDDWLFAEMVAKKLDIPLHFVDFSKEYKERVVQYMFEEYRKGRTPNPDVLCNREVKFDLFVKEALKYNADYVATGHYCKKIVNTDEKGNTIYSLLAGEDKNKDQSYFLCQVSQEQLSKALFPVGELTKHEVRKIASNLNLATAERKDSQGICFVGKVDLPTFLQQKLTPKKGAVVKINKDDFNNYYEKILSKENNSIYHEYDFSEIGGEKTGEHKGAHFYTIGQRKGLNIGGTKEPLYVVGTDTEKNIIYVGEGSSHPALYRKGLFIKHEDIHWIRPDLAMKNGEKRTFDIRIRYRQNLQKGIIERKEEGIYITFEKAQRGVTPGQFAAWYNDDELIGSGVIA
ncbi:MAG: tRNA 2-thiouridine(34) synthase MnmA [Bacteroidales bacterium]